MLACGVTHVVAHAQEAAPSLAVTEVAVVTVTEQMPLPEQAPAQPAKTESAEGVAVRVTTVPLA